jgi:hypothetical protein
MWLHRCIPQASNAQDDDDQSTQGFDWPDTRSEGGGSVVSAFSQAFSQSDSNVSVSNAGGDGESAYGKSSSRLDWPKRVIFEAEDRRTAVKWLYLIFSRLLRELQQLRENE